MATSGAYSGSAFNFSYLLVKASDPTAFFTGSFTAGDVKVVKRTGSTCAAATNITTLPTHQYEGVFKFQLSSTEMTADEVTIVINAASADVVDEAISIVTEPTPSDVLEVASASVSGVADFKATGFSTFNPASDTVANVTTVASVSGAVGSVTAAVTTDSASRTASQADVSALATAAAVNTIDSNVDAILVDTATTLPATLSTIDGKIDTVDTNVDAVLVDTGTTLPATLSTVEGKVDTIDGNVDAILVDTGTTLPATLSTIEGKVDTVDSNVDAVLVDTGTTLPATLSTMDGKIDTVDGIVDAILADTGTDGVVLSTATLQSIADEILKRDVDNVEATANEHTLATIILCLLESSRSATTWTIKRSDGTTTHATKTLTLDSAADPVVGVD